MKQIPKVQTTSRELNQVQENTRQALQPLIINALVGGAFLPNKVLTSGTNTIPHGLNRMQQGWIISDINTAVTVYRSAEFNEQNLILTASGSATVTLYVF